MQKSRLIGVEDADRLEVIIASTIHSARNRKEPDATNLHTLLKSVSALSHGTHPWSSCLASNKDLLEDFSRIFKPFLSHIRNLDELQRALELRFVFDADAFMDANPKGPDRPFRCFFRDCVKSSAKPLEQLWDLQRHLSFEHRIYIELIGEGKFSDRLLSFPLYSAIHTRETTKLTDRLTAITEEHLQSSVEQVDWSKLGGVLFLPSRMEFNPSEPGQGVSKSPCSDLARSENRRMRLFDDLLVSMRFQMRQKDLVNLLEIKTKAIDLCLTLKQSQDARGVGGERRDKLQGFQTTMIRLVIQLCDRLNLAQNLTDRYKAQVSSSACIRENSQSKEHVSLGSCDRVLSETSKMLEDMHVMSIRAAQSLLDQSVIQTSHQACESGATTGMASVLGCEDDRDTNLTSGLENCGLRSVCGADPTIFELVDEIYRTSKLLIDSLRAQVWSIPGSCTSASLLRVQRGMFHSFNGDGDDDGRKDWFEFRRSSHQVFNQKLESSLYDSSVVSLSQASSAVTSSQVKPTTGLAIYKYRPLDQATNEIRVLLVENREGRLHAKIRHISLDAWQDSYYALSYTWGGQTPTETILLEGGYTMRITPNLASALRSKVISESASEAFPVWADAICINQADVAERNTEVLKMRRIYGQARCVIIWLGAEAQNSDEALEFLQNIDRFNSRRPLEALSPSDEQWQAIYHLFKRDWFTRVWTIQEAAVSHRPTFACGQKAVDLDHRKLSTIVHYLRTCAQSRPREQRHQYALNERAMRRLDTLSWLQTWWSNACSRTVPLQFLDVLVASRHAIASNPSDKIYGLLGLAVDAVQIIPRPDYTLSYPKVYASFVRDWIRYHGSLDVICHAGSSSSCDDHLPTWVPDWKDGAGGPSFCQKTWHSEGTGNVAQVDGFMDLPPVFSDDLTEMTIWAYVLGSLDSMAGSTCSTESLEATDSNSNRRQQMSVYGTTEPTAQALQQICRMTTDNDQEWRDNFKDYVYAGRTIDCWLGTNEQYGGQSQGGSTSRFKPSEFSSSRFSSHNLDRRLFTLSTGHLGLGRDHIRVGDLVCLVPGCSAPLVIRKSLGSYFKFVGDAYLHPDGKTRGGPYGNWAIPYGTDKFTRLERFILV